MKKLKDITIFAIFPIIILALLITKQETLLFIVIPLYFIIFTFFQYENILKIIAGYHNKKNNLKKAVRYSYRAYKLKNSSIDTALIFVYLLLKNTKYDKAGEIIEEIEKREMTQLEKIKLQSNKAIYLWKKNRINDSIETFEKIIAEEDSTIVFGSYGYILTLTDDLGKALKFNEKAYKYNPNNKAILDNLGLSYMLTGNYEKSLKIYEKLLEKSPNFPEAYYNMAELMYRTKEYSEAIRYTKKALEKPFNGLSAITKKDVERKLNQLNRLQGAFE